MIEKNKIRSEKIDKKLNDFIVLMVKVFMGAAMLYIPTISNDMTRNSGAIGYHATAFLIVSCLTQYAAIIYVGSGVIDFIKSLGRD